jgi:hypothetical protein
MGVIIIIIIIIINSRTPPQPTRTLEEVNTEVPVWGFRMGESSIRVCATAEVMKLNKAVHKRCQIQV